MRQLFLVLALAWGSLACSCVGSAVVANPTDRTVTVVVTPARGDSTDKYCNCPHGYTLSGYGTVATVATDVLKGATWTPVDSSAFHWDTTGRAPKLTVEVQLTPGNSMRIGHGVGNCSGGMIHQQQPAEVAILDGTMLTRLDPIAFQDRARRVAKWLLVYEIPGVAPDSAS